YPFIGLAIVGLLRLHRYSTAAASPVPLSSLVIGILLALVPLAPSNIPPVSRPVIAIPVIAGLGLALYPLWETRSLFGIAASAILVILAGALVLLPWERIPRYLHAISPIGGLAVAFALEIQFGLSVTRVFPFVLLL